MDVDNQDVGGLQLLQELKDQPKTVQTIVHSVQNSRAFVQSMAQYGVQGYLLKPFDEERTASVQMKMAGLALIMMVLKQME